MVKAWQIQINRSSSLNEGVMLVGILMARVPIRFVSWVTLPQMEWLLSISGTQLLWDFPSHPPGKSLLLSAILDHSPWFALFFSRVYCPGAFWERVHNRKNFDFTDLKILFLLSYLILFFCCKLNLFFFSFLFLSFLFFFLQFGWGF